MSGYLWEDCLVPGNDQLLDASVKDQIDEGSQYDCSSEYKIQTGPPAHDSLLIRISESFKHGECEYSSEKRTESYYTDPALQMTCGREEGLSSEEVTAHYSDDPSHHFLDIVEVQSGPTDSSSNDDISSSDSDDRNNSPPDPTFFVPKSNQHIDGSYSAHNEVVVGHEHPHIPPNIGERQSVPNICVSPSVLQQQTRPLLPYESQLVLTEALPLQWYQKIPQGGAAYVHAEKSVAMLLQRYQKIPEGGACVYTEKSVAMELQVDSQSHQLPSEIDMNKLSLYGSEMLATTAPQQAVQNPGEMTRGSEGFNSVGHDSLQHSLRNDVGRMVTGFGESSHTCLDFTSFTAGIIVEPHHLMEMAVKLIGRVFNPLVSDVHNDPGNDVKFHIKKKISTIKQNHRRATVTEDMPVASTSELQCPEAFDGRLVLRHMRRVDNFHEYADALDYRNPNDFKRDIGQILGRIPGRRNPSMTWVILFDTLYRMECFLKKAVEGLKCTNKFDLAPTISDSIQHLKDIIKKAKNAQQLHLMK